MILFPLMCRFPVPAALAGVPVATSRAAALAATAACP
jgi:hypothetical protein